MSLITFYRANIILITILLAFSCAQKEENISRPNVILILTDDQGFGDLGVHGNKDINTPVLDQLSTESAQFDRFYVSPLCAPTRASLLTGRYHLRTGTVSVSNGLETMDAEEYTLGELFTDNGYKTALFGKWHNGQHYPNHPLAQGFQEFTGFLAGHWSNYFNTHLEKNGKEIKIDGYLPDVLTDEALAFIEKNKDQPFFTYLAYNTPHSPDQVPDAYFDPYKAKGLSDRLAAIHGMVSNLDHNIGRVLAKLNELDLNENTLVIFMTDNGPNGQRYNAGMKGIKGHVDEGGVRVPSFWRWENHIQPKLISAPAAHIDVLPTLVDLLHLKFTPQKKLDGVSLAGVLENSEVLESRSLFSHVAFPQQSLKSEPGAIRKDSLILTKIAGITALYDLKQDPSQSKDISSAFPNLTSSLSKEYDSWWNEITADINLVRTIPISAASPEIFLPTYEASFTGEIKFFEGHGWAQDWLTNWNNDSDSIYWDLEVLDPGNFEVLLEYTAEANQIGAQIEVAAGENTFNTEITEVFTGEIIPSPDRVPRKEAPEKTWKKIKIGSLNLSKGRSQLTLKASQIPTAGLGDIYSIRLIPDRK